MTFVFVSGSAALDLAGTLKWRRSRPEELLAVPADLGRWIDESPSLPRGVAVDLDGLGAALLLREAVYALAADRMTGRTPDRSCLGLVNETAAEPGLTVRLTAAGVSRAGSLRQVLAEVARSAVTSLADTDELKECSRADCTRVFLDRSRGARRTWCGMDECGNRVKAAAYRDRRRAAQRPGADQDVAQPRLG